MSAGEECNHNAIKVFFFLLYTQVQCRKDKDLLILVVGFFCLLTSSVKYDSTTLVCDGLAIGLNFKCLVKGHIIPVMCREGL